MQHSPQLQETDESLVDCKIIARPADLLKSLQLVLPIVPKSSPGSPILTNFLLEIENNYLKVTGYDNKNTIIAEQELTHLVGKSKLCIQAHLLCDILKELDASEEITVILHDKKLTISATCGTYNLISQDEAEFPRIKKSASVFQTVLETELVSRIIRMRYACSNDENRTSLNGIFFKFSEQFTEFIAGDGHLAHQIRRFDIKAEDKSALIPGRTLSSLEALIKGEDFVKLNLMNNHFAFSATSTQFITTQIQEKYISYEKALDSSGHSHTVKITRLLLIASLERIALLQPYSDIVNVEIGDGHILLKAESHLGDVQETIVHTSQMSASFGLSFTLKKLYAVVKHLDTIVIELLYKKPAAPVFFQPSPQRDHEEEKILLIPMYFNPDPNDFD